MAGTAAGIWSCRSDRGEKLSCNADAADHGCVGAALFCDRDMGQLAADHTGGGRDGGGYLKL